MQLEQKRHCFLYHNKAMPPKSKNAKTPSEQHAAPADDAPPEEEETDALWLNHPAREILRLAFWNGEIPLDWNRQPVTIYNKFKDRKEFQGMPYDATFQRRLLNLRGIVKNKMNRRDGDKIAFDTFRKNFPVRQVNDVGVLRWHGSLAQYYLKMDMKTGLHKGKKPAEFRATRAEYLQYPKDTFRKHISQELKLWKLEHFLELKEQKDAAKVAKRAKLKSKAQTKAKAKAKAMVQAKKSEEKIPRTKMGTRMTWRKSQRRKILTPKLSYE
jgi:hypothetical protein